MNEPVYEMLWNCKYCGAQKLLGNAHRCCPNCGAPQDVASRYFPSDADKVQVAHHVYVGADVVCGSCREASSKNAKHCGNCGAPLTGAGSVALRPDQVAAAGGAYAMPQAVSSQSASGSTPVKRRAVWPWIVLSVVALAVVVVGITLFWKKEGSFVVNARSWERGIAIERFGPVEHKAWCDQVPSRGRVIARERRERDQRKVPDGEDCQVRKVDHGDGTFREERECTPKFRSEPVYDQYCRYEVEEWAKAREEVVRGGENTPSWPTPRLREGGSPGASCLGCERAGARRESYVVRLMEAGGKADECSLPEVRWRSFSTGSHVKGQVRALTGGIVCDSLAP